MVLNDDFMESKRQTTPRQFRYKLIKTATLIIFWITAGMFIGLVSTTYVDFKDKLKTDYKKLAIMMAFRTVGTILGAVISSVLRDMVGVQGELVAGATACVASVVNFLKPWSPTIILFGVLNCIEGGCLSCANSVCNAIMLRLWGKKASAPLHAFHFGFGLGLFLSPLLAKDFLSERCPVPEDKSNKTQDFGNNVTALALKCQNSTEDNPTMLTEGQLVIPFSVVGSLLAGVGFVFLTFYFLEKCSVDFRLSYTEPQKVLRKDKTAADERNSKSSLQSIRYFVRTFYFRFVVGLVLMYGCIATFEGVGNGYLLTFAYESGLGFSKKEAAYLSSAYFGIYALSRLLAVLIAHFLSVKIMLFVEIIGTLGSLLLMFFSGFQHRVGMWASGCLLGFFIGPVWPSGIAWADRYVLVKTSVVAGTDIAAYVVASIAGYFGGILLDNKQGRSFLYIASGLCLAALLLLSVLQFFGSRHGDRHDVDHTTGSESSEKEPLSGSAAQSNKSQN